jgi:hypothetical protein
LAEAGVVISIEHSPDDSINENVHRPARSASRQASE